MAFKDLLVHFDRSRTADNRLQAAATLARQWDAHLTGLFVMDVPRLPGYAEVQIPQSILDLQREALLEEARLAEQRFRAILDRSGMTAEWRAVEGPLVDTVARHALCADLTVLGRADPDDPRCVSAGLADKIVLETGRPVLVIPGAAGPTNIGRHVLVAWNGKREAARSVGDAMPLLEDADKVDVIMVNPHKTDPGNRGIPVADIGVHLARHGIRTDAQEVSATGGVGRFLVKWAEEENVDLIVMGAYGHTRFRELVLGGATAEVLRESTIPTLLSH